MNKSFHGTISEYQKSLGSMFTVLYCKGDILCLSVDLQCEILMLYLFGHLQLSVFLCVLQKAQSDTEAALLLTAAHLL